MGYDRTGPKKCVKKVDGCYGHWQVQVYNGRRLVGFRNLVVV